MTATTISGLTILAPLKPGFQEILTPEALDLVVELERRFDDERRRLLEVRGRRQTLLDAGQIPDFLTETAPVRQGLWTIGPLPADLLDRRV